MQQMRAAGSTPAAESCEETRLWNCTQCNRDKPRYRATRGKRRAFPLDHIDGRTAAAKRARDLMESIEQDLGGADRSVRARASLCSERRCWAPLHRELRSVGGCPGEDGSSSPITLPPSISQRRVLQTIGLERRARDVNELTLSEYLSRAHSETVAEVATGEAETRSMGRRKGRKRRADVPEPESFVDHDADGDGSP